MKDFAEKEREWERLHDPADIDDDDRETEEPDWEEIATRRREREMVTIIC